MKHKQYIIPVSSSILLFLLTTISAVGGHNLKFLFGAIVYCLIPTLIAYRSAFWNRNFKELLCIFAIPLLLVYIPVYLADNQHTMVSMPSSLAQFLGVILSAIIFYNRPKIKIYILVTYLVAIIWVYFWGYNLWMNKVNFGTYTYHVSMKAPEFNFQQSNGISISNESMKDKILVLDFWNTRCGVCFSEFPHFEDIIEKYKNETDILFFAVNIPIKGDSIGYAVNMIKQRGYDFSVIIANSKAIAQQFNIYAYPTIIVINKGDKIIYKGNLANLEKTLSKIN